MQINFAAKFTIMVDTTLIHNGLQDRNSDFRKNWQRFLYILGYRNLLKFGPVTPEFTTLECVRQASIVIGVSLTTFARGYSARPGGLHISLCHAFL